MSYLILSDYKKQIQTLNLSQITGGDDTILNQWAQTAQEKCISYLVQKYDTAAEFTDTMAWDPTRTYNPGDRVYDQNNVIYYVAYPFPLFNSNLNYNTGDKVYWKGKIYTAVNSSSYPDRIQYSYIASIPPINYFPDYLINGQPNSQWGAGEQYSLPAGTNLLSYFYVPSNDPNISYNNDGHFVYADTRLTGLSGYSIYSFQLADMITLDMITYDPDAGSFTLLIPGFTLVNGSRLIVFTSYLGNTVPNNNPPVITEGWITGDNRSQQMVQTCIDIVLFYVHQRISPNNIPELRVFNYNMAIQWLKDAAVGNVTPNLPVKQPNQGHRIRFGGAPKLNNSY